MKAILAGTTFYLQSTHRAQLYALDDAIANQKSLQRPLSFIKPLEDLRAMIARNLVEMTSKGEKVEPEKPTDNPA